MSEQKLYDSDFKARVVLEALQGRKSIDQLCQDYGIAPDLLARWKDNFVAHAPQVFMNEGMVNTQADQQAAIRFIDGPLKGKSIAIQKPVTVIGRDGQNDIVVVDPKVSRRHARIIWHLGSWLVENLSQTSFIAINRQRVQQGKLADNCVVSLGEDCSFVFLSQTPTQSTETPPYE